MLDDTARTLASADNLAALTTLSACGQPQTQIMWVDRDEDHVVVNTEVGRQRFRNVEHDPRVTITIWESPAHTTTPRCAGGWSTRSPGPRHVTTSIP